MEGRGPHTAAPLFLEEHDGLAYSTLSHLRLSCPRAAETKTVAVLLIQLTTVFSAVTLAALMVVPAEGRRRK
jgi:hypothetical protein